MPRLRTVGRPTRNSNFGGATRLQCRRPSGSGMNRTIMQVRRETSAPFTTRKGSPRRTSIPDWRTYTTSLSRFTSGTSSAKAPRRRRPSACSTSTWLRSLRFAFMEMSSGMCQTKAVSRQASARVARACIVSLVVLAISGTPLRSLLWSLRALAW
jgi:hypothetical protein